MHIFLLFIYKSTNYQLYLIIDNVPREYEDGEIQSLVENCITSPHVFYSEKQPSFLQLFSTTIQFTKKKNYTIAND